MKVIRDLLPLLAEQIDKNHNSNVEDEICEVMSNQQVLPSSSNRSSENTIHVRALDKDAVETDILAQIALETSIEKLLPVIIFTLKNSSTEVAFRLLATAANLSLEQLQFGRLADKDWEQLTDGLEKLVDANVYIDDCHLDKTNIISTISLVKFIHDKIGIVLIDDLQLICK